MGRNGWGSARDPAAVASPVSTRRREDDDDGEEDEDEEEVEDEISTFSDVEAPIVVTALLLRAPAWPLTLTRLILEAPVIAGVTAVVATMPVIADMVCIIGTCAGGFSR